MNDKENEYIGRMLDGLRESFSMLPEVVNEWEERDQIDFGIDFGGDLMMLSKFEKKEKRGLLNAQQSTKLKELKRMLDEYRPYLKQLDLRYKE